MIYLSDSMYHAPVTPATPAEVQARRSDPRLKERYRLIAQGGHDELKKENPILVVNGRPLTGERQNDQMEWNDLFIAECDDHGCHETLWAATRERLDELGILLFERSARGGVHMICRRTEGLTPDEDICRMERALGVTLDHAPKAKASALFIVPEEYVYYESPALYADTTPWTYPTAKGDNPAPPSATTAEAATTTAAAPAADFRFKGRLISDIAADYLKAQGTPEPGTRHTFYYQMCTNFRFITDNDRDVMLAQLPTFDLPLKERQKICDHACRVNCGAFIPNAFWHFLHEMGLVASQCERRQEAADEADDPLVCEAATVALPDVLPPIFNEYCGPDCPPEFRWPFVVALLPILGTLCTRARATYLDGSEQLTNFHSVVFCPASGGKSNIMRLFHQLTRTLQQHDEVEWVRERLYKEELRNHKNDKNQPKDPHIHLRILSPVISVPRLLYRQNDSLGLHQLSFTPEIDTVIRSNRGGRGQDKNDLYRIAWDGESTASQDYMMNETFSGQVLLHMNFLMTGTPKSVASFYGNSSLENGLVSRASFAEIRNQEFAAMPKVKALTPHQQHIVDEQLKRFDDMTYRTEMNAEGEVTYDVRPTVNLDRKLAFFLPALEGWLEEKRLQALASDDVPLDHFRRRAALKAFRLAMICVSMYDTLNRTRQQVITRFCLAYADFDTEEHVRLYGSEFNDNTAAVSFHYPNLFAEMPDAFTLDDLKAVIDRHGLKSKAKMVVFRWTHNGLIDRLDNGFRKRSAAPLPAPAADEQEE